MRERLRDRGRLSDIMEYAANAMQFAEDVSYEEFETNWEEWEQQ